MKLEGLGRIANCGSGDRVGGASGVMSNGVEQDICAMISFSAHT